MMNASIHARLPEKLAAAEAKEADQREAKGLETRYPKLNLVLFQSKKLYVHNQYLCNFAI